MINNFNQIVVVRNPLSTNARKADQRIEELQTLYPKTNFKIIETSKQGYAANVTQLVKSAKYLGPQTLLCIAAGDGTVSMVVNALLLDARFSEKARHTILLPLWCGNANDLACMLNGVLRRNTLKNVIERGKVASIWPLMCTLENLDGSLQNRIAICYASFGASAFTAHWLDRIMRATDRPLTSPGVRFIRELLLVRQALAKAPRFTVREHGRKNTIFERTILNGPRFAKVSGVPLQLQDKHFYMGSVEHKNFIALVRQALQLTSRRHAQQFVCNRANFSVQDSLWAQFDGEPLELSASTHISIKIAEQPLYVLNTKL